MFCQECCRLLQKIRSTHCQDSWGSRDHHQSYLAYAEAVASGCRICTRLPFRDEERDKWKLSCNWFRFEHVTSRSAPYPSNKPLKLRFVLRTFPEVGSRFSWLFLLSYSAFSPCTAYSPVENTGSKESLALANHWLKACVDSHLACNHLRAVSLQDWNPTRLVFVGTKDDHAVRLCEGSAIHHRVTYLTLSHCWGTNPHRKVLTRENVASWFREIPRSEIMRTFQDAIDVTRALGVQYLWIDSLCIIQGCGSDWLHESSTMSDVYRFSYCNIAAAHATSDEVGLFVDRETPECPPMSFGPSNFESCFDDRSEEIFAGPYEEDEYHEAWYKLRNSPLYKRAWVMQERILSPRILHFAGRQLFWECNDLRTCELFPGELPRGLWHIAGLQDSKIYDFEGQSSVAMTPPATIHPPVSEGLAMWADVVQNYSQCQLTIEADKLIAISAIARALKPAMQCQYLAGLWEKDLLNQLEWRMSIPSAKHRPATYRAPSWSWASVEGRCYFRHYSGVANPLIEIRSSHVDPASDDEMGAVKAGYLDVTGQLFVLGGVPRDLDRIEVPGFDEGWDFWRDCSLDEINGPLLLLPLTLNHPPGNITMKFTHLKALVLQQCAQQACYQRVGYAEAFFDSENSARSSEMLGDFREMNMGSGDKTWSFSRNDSRMQHLRLV